MLHLCHFLAYFYATIVTVADLSFIDSAAYLKFYLRLLNYSTM